jgi:predicted permease
MRRGMLCRRRLVGKRKGGGSAVLVFNLSVRLALLILTGYVAGRLKVLPAEAKPILVKLLMNVALPCLIVGSFAVNAVKGELLQFGYVLLAAAIVLAVSTLIGHLVYILMGRSNAGAAAKVCIIFGNVTFFGIRWWRRSIPLC